MKSHKLLIILSTIIIGLFTTACEDWLDEQPLDQLSLDTFWATEDDATLALVGVYKYGVWGGPIGIRGDPLDDVLGHNHCVWRLMIMSDEGTHKAGRDDRPILITPTQGFISENWERAYRGIHKANVFLANIGAVEMDAAKKAQYIAEARFIRAYTYFIITQWWGDVPLVKDELSVQEANELTRTPQADVVSFILTELTEAAADLPAVRPASEKGRISKSAALAYKGRLLMAEQRWSEAAATYKEVMDLGVHAIDSRFKELFEVSGESSSEIVFSIDRTASIAGNSEYQVWYHSTSYGGYSVINIFQETVDAFGMIDGLPIGTSPLYDPDNPFENRDPRLYASVLLPDYSVWRGQLHTPHPDKSDIGVKAGAGRTGYGLKKFTTEDYDGEAFSSSADYIYLRYSEVLLSYLESKLEAGDGITQALLDQTINEVRGRESLGVAPVTETDPNLLREIVRNERRVEFLGEPGIRLWDLNRWKIAHTALRGEFHGIKLTDNPSIYTDYKVDENGHLFVVDRQSFEDHNYLWPIPLSEIDVNPNLVQNPGYTAD